MDKNPQWLTTARLILTSLVPIVSLWWFEGDNELVSAGVDNTIDAIVALVAAWAGWKEIINAKRRLSPEEYTHVETRVSEYRTKGKVGAYTI